jgi:hypothetical protein
MADSLSDEVRQNLIKMHQNTLLRPGWLSLVIALGS